MPGDTNATTNRAQGLGGPVADRGRRYAGALIRQLFDHPFEIDRYDASAASLWPANPEEPETPRWRFAAPFVPDLIEHGMPRSAWPEPRAMRACVVTTPETCR